MLCHCIHWAFVCYANAAINATVKINNNTPKIFTLYNPFIIETDDDNFYFFSIMLNDICSTIYEKYKNYDTIILKNIESEFRSKIDVKELIDNQDLYENDYSCGARPHRVY